MEISFRVDVLSRVDPSHAVTRFLCRRPTIGYSAIDPPHFRSIYSDPAPASVSTIAQEIRHEIFSTKFHLLETIRRREFDAIPAEVFHGAVHRCKFAGRFRWIPADSGRFRRDWRVRIDPVFFSCLLDVVCSNPELSAGIGSFIHFSCLLFFIFAGSEERDPERMCLINTYQAVSMYRFEIKWLVAKRLSLFLFFCIFGRRTGWSMVFLLSERRFPDGAAGSDAGVDAELGRRGADRLPAHRRGSAAVRPKPTGRSRQQRHGFSESVNAPRRHTHTHTHTTHTHTIRSS